MCIRDRYGDEALTREERLAGLNADDYRSSHDCIAVDGVTNSDAGVNQQPSGKMADGARFIGIELQPACADMAARSVSLNGLDVYKRQEWIRTLHLRRPWEHWRR